MKNSKRVKLKREKNIDIMELISNNDIDRIIKNIDVIPLDKPIHLNMYLLHYATLLNRVDLLKVILKNNNKWDYQDNNGYTIAHVAAFHGYCEILEFIAKKFENKILEVKNNNNENILFLLIQHPQCFNNIKNLNIKKYINEENNNNDTPLSNAIYLLTNTFNIHSNKIINNKYRQIEPNKIIKNYDISNPLFKSIKILLENGAEQNIKITEPPIVIASRYNDFELVDLLLKYDCDVNMADKGGKTALGWAIYNNNIEMIKLLIKHKANIDTYTILGNSYLPIVAINFGSDNIIEYILEQKINYEFTDYNQNTIAHIVLLNYIEYPLNIIKTVLKNTNNYNKQNLDGNSIGHLICMLSISFIENMKDILTSKRMNLYIKNREGKICIDYIENDSKKKMIYDIIKDSLMKQMADIKLVKPKEYEDIEDLIINKKITCLYTKEELENEQIENSIKIIEYPYANYNLFKNKYMDSLIMFAIIFDRNSKDMTIPIIRKEEIIGIDKYKKSIDHDLEKSSEFKINMINHHYTFMIYLFSEIITCDILWFDKNNYIFTEYHDIAFLKALERKERFIVFMLGLFIHENQVGHANVLIYDKKLNILERFDPEGIINMGVLDDLDIFLKDRFKKLIKKNDFRYISPKDYGIINSFQKLSDEVNSLKRKTGDVKGFCQAWVFWYLEMRILNKSINPIKLVEKLLNKLIKMNNSSIFEYIRNYANDLRKKVYNFMVESNIDPKIINNEEYPNNVAEIIGYSVIKLIKKSM